MKFITALIVMLSLAPAAHAVQTDQCPERFTAKVSEIQLYPMDWIISHASGFIAEDLQGAISLVQAHPTIVKTYVLTDRKSGRCTYHASKYEYGFLWTQEGQNRLQVWMRAGNLTYPFLLKTTVTEYSPTAMRAGPRATFQYGGGYDAPVAHLGKPTSVEFRVQ